jgi:hypothetical protein
MTFLKVWDTNHTFCNMVHQTPKRRILFCDIEQLVQKILLKALAKTPKTTVLIINGHSSYLGTEINNFYEVTQNKLIVMGNGIDSFKDYINEWYKLIV